MLKGGMLNGENDVLWAKQIYTVMYTGYNCRDGKSCRPIIYCSCIYKGRKIIVLLRLLKSVPKTWFFGKTEPNRNRGFMPLCWRFWKRSCSSGLIVPWTLITRGLAGVAARVIGDCASGAALLRVRGGGWDLERLNEWRTVRTGERRRTGGG